MNLSLPAVVPLVPPFLYTQSVLNPTALDMEQQNAVEIGYSGVLTPNHAICDRVSPECSKKIWFLPVSFYGPGMPPRGWPGKADSVPLLRAMFSFVNLGGVRDRGIELAIRTEWPRLSLRKSYTFQDVPLLKNEETAFPLQINRPARHQAGGGLTFTPGRWSVAGDVHYTDRAFWSDVLTEPFWG